MAPKKAWELRWVRLIRKPYRKPRKSPFSTIIESKHLAEWSYLELKKNVDVIQLELVEIDLV